MAGRPSKLNPEMQDAITSLLANGNYFDTSCTLSGITERTGYRWLERGEAELERRQNPQVKEGSKQWVEEQPYVEFCQAVKRASAEAETVAVDTIKNGVAQKDKHGNEWLEVKDWQRIAWFLERRYPSKWGRMQRIDHTSNGETLTFKVSFDSRDD